MEQKSMVDTVPIEQLVNKIGVETVFGAPRTENGETIIPVAQVEFGFGYGGGYGQRAGDGEAGVEPQESAEEGVEGAAEGGGGGGGAGGRASPRGYIRVSSQGVKYEPITDEMRIPLAGIFMVAWSVFWIAMTIRAIAKSVASVKRAKR